MTDPSARHPQDPRAAFPGHRERGPRRFSYTYEDVAHASGRAVGTVRKDASRGRLDPADLLSVARYVLRYRLGVTPRLIPVDVGWSGELAEQLATLLHGYATGKTATLDIRALPAAIDALILVQQALDDAVRRSP